MKRLSDKALRAAVGRAFSGIRKSLGISQGEVGEQSTVAKVESGSNFPSWPTMLAMCRKYRVSPSEVLQTAEEELGADADRTVVAVGPEEHLLLTLYAKCNAEGRRVFMERAKAAAALYPK
jgi:transcriptional regulator with XRE-family HTH domain